MNINHPLNVTRNVYCILAMIKTKINIIRNKFFFLLGIIIFLSIFFFAFNNLQSHENELLEQIEKLELQNEAMNKQAEGNYRLYNK